MTISATQKLWLSFSSLDLQTAKRKKKNPQKLQAKIKAKKIVERRGRDWKKKKKIFSDSISQANVLPTSSVLCGVRCIEQSLQRNLLLGHICTNQKG